MKTTTRSCDACGEEIVQVSRCGIKLGEIILKLVPTSQEAEDEHRLDEGCVDLCEKCMRRFVSDGEFVLYNRKACCWPDTHSDSPLAKVRDLIRESQFE